MTKKLNKSKRMTVSIPKGTEIEAFLINNGKVAYWESLEQLIKQLPKSKEDRAYKSFLDFQAQFLELYPGNLRALNLLWLLISKRLIKIPDLDSGKECVLPDSYYEELKRL